MQPIDADSWSSLKVLAIAQMEQEPILSGHLYDLVLRHRGYPEALAYLVAATLSNRVFSLAAMVDLIGETIERNPEIATATLADLRAIVTRDPAAGSPLNCLRSAEPACPGPKCRKPGRSGPEPTRLQAEG
ncbi:MAG: hypothetical protein ABI702_13430 [Burkholderiales bacterium]